jgi:uncharacterized GH25 family protein
MVFQAQVVLPPNIREKSINNNLVEVERYNSSPPKDPPADEHRTRTVKPDPNGVVTATLTDPGWWCLTASRDGDANAKDGKQRTHRTTLWVFVDEKPGSK